MTVIKRERFCLRVYNLPEVDESVIVSLLRSIPNLKREWIAKDANNICQGWAWCEFNNMEDLTTAMNYINNTTCQGTVLQAYL